LAFVTGILASPRTAATDPTDFVTIGVLLLNPANVGPDTLTRAKAEATRIYQGLRITLVWTESDEAAVDYQFTVKIVSEAISGKGIDGRAMGVAVGTREKRGTLAYAFYDRIKDVTQTIGADKGLILGHVIAHEIGHLLLPYDSHANSGLMRGGWDTRQALSASRGSLTFTPQEAALIRARLQNVNAATVRR
jgi:hypothetical protein